MSMTFLGYETDSALTMGSFRHVGVEGITMWGIVHPCFLVSGLLSVACPKECPRLASTHAR